MMSCSLYGDYCPSMSRDFRRLTTDARRGYYSPMRTFREALLKKLEETGTSLKKVADGANVSYEQLKKLKQIDSRSTNVEDAIKVAHFFNMTLDEFMSGVEAKAPDEIISVLEKLSPVARNTLLNAAKAQLAEENVVPLKSPSTPSK